MCALLPAERKTVTYSVDLILKDGLKVLEKLCHLQFFEFKKRLKIILMIAIFAHEHFEVWLG